MCVCFFLLCISAEVEFIVPDWMGLFPFIVVACCMVLGEMGEVDYCLLQMVDY